MGGCLRGQEARTEPPRRPKRVDVVATDGLASREQVQSVWWRALNAHSKPVVCHVSAGRRSLMDWGFYLPAGDARG